MSFLPCWRIHPREDTLWKSGSAFQPLTAPPTLMYLQEAFIDCPWCGECYPTQIDTSQGDHELIEDCTVCCRPISVLVECSPGDLHSVQSQRP